MKIALAQINPVVGDFAFNASQIISAMQEAQKKSAGLVVFPEMCLFGYPAYDLLERSQLIDAQLQELKNVLKAVPKGVTAIFGAVIKNRGKMGKPYQNVAVVAQKSKKPLFAAKQLLPSYDIFDDTRFFEPGTKTLVFSLPGVGKTAVTVCEDMWAQSQNYKNDPLKGLKGIKLVVNISASPFDIGKIKRRETAAKDHAKKLKAPFVYVNQVGGQDELIFDGQSFILDKHGKEVDRLPAFENMVGTFDLSNKSSLAPTLNSDMTLRKALVLGIKDFVKKTGQSKVHLGLSGGIDSALVACLAAEALGPENVVGLMLPGPYSSEGSVSDSEKLASALGIKTEKISIQDLFKAGLASLEALGLGSADQKEIAQQNLQARARGLILMLYSNLTGSMLLATSNKSELAAGYSTLYGDTCGGLMPIGDLVKGQVYSVAKLYSAIPQEIFDKAPSAELAPNQKDQDSLPPYDQLDKAVENLVTLEKRPSGQTEEWLEKKLKNSEFKRWQSPPILRVSRHAFGRGRRIPVARK